MIKLNSTEIRAIEDKIWGEINEYNIHYFKYKKKEYSHEAYMLDGNYINLNLHNCIWWLGIIKIKEESSLKRLPYFFNLLLKQKNTIGIWTSLDNKRMSRLFKACTRYFKVESVIIEKENIEYIIIRR
ncbi:MAG: hypothetical protein ACRCX2_20895 [Paraclostridium sp.]